MKKIEINSYYSLREAVKFTPLKTRETLSRYINRYQGSNWSKNKIWIKGRTSGKGRTSVRYVISGKWIKEFNKQYNAGKLVEHNIFSSDNEIRYTLKDIVDYCKRKKILTIKEFVNNKQNEKQESILSVKNS